MTPHGARTQGIVSSKREGRGEGRWARDPYGRGRILKIVALQFAFVYVVALLAGGPRSAAQRIGIVTLPCAWLAALAVVVLWNPAPRAAREGETLAIRVTTWKRYALPVVLPLPAWAAPLYVTRTATTPSWWWVAWLLGSGALTLVLYWSLRDRYHVTAWGVCRAVAGLGPRHEIAWNDVTRIGLWPAGITLGAPGKPTVSLYGIMLDGYPELVREVLRRIPHVVDATPGARERLERGAALVPGNEEPSASSAE